MSEPMPGDEFEAMAVDSNEESDSEDSSSDADESSRDSEPAERASIKYSGPDQKLADRIKLCAVDSSPGVKWDEIAGLKDAKMVLKEAGVLPLLMPEYFREIRRPWKGVLLFGPPGTGKTLLAKAIATSSGTTFFHISLASLGSEWIGESERLVRCLFAMARQNAPSTIFIDEIDSLCRDRGGSDPDSSSVSKAILPQLLVEIDGVTASNKSCPSKFVMVLGATNNPWNIDAAMRRRMEKRVYVPLPDLESRKELVRINMRSVEVSEDLDYDEIARATQGYSGDDLTNVCRDAAFSGMRRAIQDKTDEEIKEMAKKKEISRIPVTMSDFLQAVTKVKSSISTDSLERFNRWSSEFGSA